MFALVCLLVLLITVPALAQTLADPSSNPSGWFEGLYTAVVSSDWKHAAALALIGVVYAVRKWGPEKISWFKESARGGAVLVVLLAVIGGTANSLIANGGVSLKTFAVAIQIALEASIGWMALFKALVENKKSSTPGVA